MMPTTADSTEPLQSTTEFDRKTFKVLGGAGMATGLALTTLGYFTLAGSVPAIEDPGARLAFGFRWMAFPALAIVFGFMAAGNSRFTSAHADGTAPPEDSSLNLHRRYLQNTLEQFAYFFVTQMALVTLLPSTALHLVPVFAVLFLTGRLLFWRGYKTNPAYRAFGLTMTHVNLLALGYVIYRVVTG